MSLSDQDSSMMERVSKFLFGDDSLESSFHELIKGKSEDVIELSLVFYEETKSDHSSEKGITFEKSSGIILGQSHQGSTSLSDFGEGGLDSLYLSLASESAETDNSELIDKSVFIEWFPWGRRSFL